MKEDVNVKIAYHYRNRNRFCGIPGFFAAEKSRAENKAAAFSLCKDRVCTCNVTFFLKQKF